MIFKKSGPPEWLLVCLGNYGKQYENTRHNIGFMAAERLIDKRDLRCNRLRFRALTEVIEFGGANVLLMMPQTYMNLSGEAVGEAARFYKIPADHVIVISDDISLPLGKLRVRGSGSAGGHNGLKNIIAHLGTDAFPRVKVGVGAPEHDIVDWVIGPFTANERKVIDGVLDRALGAEPLQRLNAFCRQNLKNRHRLFAKSLYNKMTDDHGHDPPRLRRICPFARCRRRDTVWRRG